MPPRAGTEQTPLLHNEQWHGEEDNEEQACFLNQSAHNPSNTSLAVDLR